MMKKRSVDFTVLDNIPAVSSRYAVAQAAGPGRKLRFLLGHASGAWSEAPLPARPCIRGLVGSSASCSAMHPGPGRKLRFLLGHASGAWSEAPLPARPCIRGLNFLFFRQKESLTKKNTTQGGIPLENPPFPFVKIRVHLWLKFLFRISCMGQGFVGQNQILAPKSNAQHQSAFRLPFAQHAVRVLFHGLT